MVLGSIPCLNRSCKLAAWPKNEEESTLEPNLNTLPGYGTTSLRAAQASILNVVSPDHLPRSNGMSFEFIHLSLSELALVAMTFIHATVSPPAARCQASIWSPLTHTPHCTLTNRLKRQSDLACLLLNLHCFLPTASRASQPQHGYQLLPVSAASLPLWTACSSLLSRAGTQRLLLPHLR